MIPDLTLKKMYNKREGYRELSQWLKDCIEEIWQLRHRITEQEHIINVYKEAFRELKGKELKDE